MMKSTGLGVEEERILYDAMIGTRGGGYLYKLQTVLQTVLQS